MFCSNCGKEIPENSQFCVSCGKLINKGETQEKIKGLFKKAEESISNLSIKPKMTTPLMEGENILFQTGNVANYCGKMALNGMLTITNKRFIHNPISIPGVNITDVIVQREDIVSYNRSDVTRGTRNVVVDMISGEYFGITTKDNYYKFGSKSIETVLQAFSKFFPEIPFSNEDPYYTGNDREKFIEQQKDSKFFIYGVNGQLKVYDEKVVISRKGVLGFLSQGLAGEKSIPIFNIQAVQVKEAGPVINGYIQFSLSGGRESTGGAWNATQDENTIMFGEKDNNVAREIQRYIEEKISNSHFSNPTIVKQESGADEILKYKQLLDEGILTQEEFDAKKKQILGI